MIKLVNLLFSIAIAGYCMAQSPVQSELPQSPAPLKEARFVVEEGTYQVILKDQRMLEPEITSGILQLISQNRKQNEVNTITLDAYTEIRILSFSEINAPNFTPIKTYVYEN